jgi:hypothetical protein
MRSITSRTLSVLTSLALFAGATGFGTLASAASGGPTVVLSSTTATTTNVSSIPVTVTFSEAVTGFASNDLALVNASVTSFAGSGASYTFNLVPVTNGSVSVQIAADESTAVSAPFKGNQASNMLTFMSDVTAPVITNVAVSTATSSATVTWTTSEPATGQVGFGTTTSYGSASAFDSSLSTSHTATLTGLSAGTTYHFQIVSTDAAGNMAATSDATFAIASVPSAPMISNISVSVTGTSTATIMWNTDAAASGQVFFGTTASLGSSTTLNSTASTTHSVNLSNLTQGTTYHFVVVSANGNGTATSSDQVFTTNPTASSTPLAVTGIDAVKTVATADGTFASGWKWIIHFTVPTSETSFQMKFSDFTNPTSSTTIPVAGNVRYSSVQSSNASTTASAIVESNNNYGTALTLTGDTSTTTPGRQVDVVVEVAVPVGTPSGGLYSTIFGALSQ